MSERAAQEIRFGLAALGRGITAGAGWLAVAIVVAALILR